MARRSIPTLTAEEQVALAEWTETNGHTVPELVRHALKQHAVLQEALRGTKHQFAALIRQLRRAMGITPSSEKRSGRSGGRRKGRRRRRSRREALWEMLLRAIRLAKGSRDRARARGRDIVRLQKLLDELSEEELDAPESDMEWTDEEAAELETEHREMLARCALGERPDPALEPADETLITGAEVTTVEERVSMPAPEHGDDEQVVDTRTEERIRYDFTLVVGRVIAEVEKKVVVGKDGKKRMLSGSTTSLGPPRLCVTWRSAVNIPLLVVQYAMPMNRLAHLISTPEKTFTSGSIGRVVNYVAERAVPIYLHLFGKIANAGVWMGDDTTPRVLETSRYFANASDDEPPPWAHYRTREIAHECEEEGIEVQLARTLGFEFARRDQTGPKRALNTSVIAGREDPDDPQSLIVFYRSHIGAFGNLLEVLLKQRDPSAGGVTVQSDLAAVNFVTDSELLDRFPIRRAGCTCHARRPFSIHEADDKELCEIMLTYFDSLFAYEELLDSFGRNRENTAAVRDVDHRAIWNNIKELAVLIARKWSKETMLGKGARYILRHFDALTAYLDDPRLDPTNNFSERMLRLEKLIEASSMFRVTLRGRFALDILRTIFQTAVAAQAPLQEYLLYVLQSDPDDVAAHPERYTPREWMREYGEALTDNEPPAPDIPMEQLLAYALQVDCKDDNAPPPDETNLDDLALREAIEALDQAVADSAFPIDRDLYEAAALQPSGDPDTEHEQRPPLTRVTANSRATKRKSSRSPPSAKKRERHHRRKKRQRR